MDMPIEFLRDRERAQIGQKADATPCAVVSVTSNGTIPFGALVVFDGNDPFLCKLPTAKADIDKPVGIALSQLHCENYQPKSSIAAMRKGRVWVQSEKVDAPGDAVYVKFLDDGSNIFTGAKTGAFAAQRRHLLGKDRGRQSSH